MTKEGFIKTAARRGYAANTSEAAQWTKYNRKEEYTEEDFVPLSEYSDRNAQRADQRMPAFTDFCSFGAED